MMVMPVFSNGLVCSAHSDYVHRVIIPLWLLTNDYRQVYLDNNSQMGIAVFARTITGGIELYHNTRADAQLNSTYAYHYLVYG